MSRCFLYKGKDLEESDIPTTALGFIYKIVHVDTGRWYIGRKMLTSASSKMVNGKKKKIRKESDWRTYFGSSPYLIEEMKENGKDAYTREIILFVSTKSQLLVAEEYYLHVSGSMFTEMSYNSNIRSKIFKKWFAKDPGFWDEMKNAGI